LGYLDAKTRTQIIRETVPRVLLFENEKFRRGGLAGRGWDRAAEVVVGRARGRRGRFGAGWSEWEHRAAADGLDGSTTFLDDVFGDGAQCVQPCEPGGADSVLEPPLFGKWPALAGGFFNSAAVNGGLIRRRALISEREVVTSGNNF
jgi:hypothetical protein